MKIKTNKNIFIFGKSPTRFDLAPTYLHRSSLDKIVCWVDIFYL